MLLPSAAAAAPAAPAAADPVPAAASAALATAAAPCCYLPLLLHASVAAADRCLCHPSRCCSASATPPAAVLPLQLMLLPLTLLLLACCAADDWRCEPAITTAPYRPASISRKYNSISVAFIYFLLGGGSGEGLA